MKQLVWVVAADYIDGYKLMLCFNDGARKVFDFGPLIKTSPLYNQLSDIADFVSFDVNDWTVSWNNGKIDIAPEYLYQHGKVA